MTKRLQVYEHEGTSVVFDPTLCIHAAERVRHLPKVFRPRERRWVPREHGEATAVAAAVHRCPTGALPASGPHAPAPDETVTVRAIPHGPLEIRGRHRLVRDDGSEADGPSRVALCRCGRSSNKPFCDGTHAR